MTPSALGGSSPLVEIMRTFFSGLRQKGFHLGLDPEFSGLEKLAIAQPEEQYTTLREHLDQFYWGRGFEVLRRVQQKAVQAGEVDIAKLLGLMDEFVHKVFEGQFLMYAKGETVPQPEMLREILRLFNEDPQKMEVYVDQHLEELDGHFFMAISESLRHSRTRGYEGNLALLPLLGMLVATSRIERGLPCNFAKLFRS
jgi:hypothetical protein